MFTIPLFPLHTVLFPNTPIHLHIFEEKYYIMVRHCQENNLPFGVALISKGKEVSDESVETRLVGCSARLTQVETLRGGRFNITARGETRFIIHELDHSQPYLQAKVDAVPLGDEQMLEQLPGYEDIPSLFTRYLNLVGQIGGVQPDHNQVKLPRGPINMLYMAASVLQLPAFEKQPLLEASDAVTLFNQVHRLYRRETAVLKNLLTRGGMMPKNSRPN